MAIMWARLISRYCKTKKELQQSLVLSQLLRDQKHCKDEKLQKLLATIAENSPNVNEEKVDELESKLK